MLTLELIEENSSTCPVDTATNVDTTSGTPTTGGIPFPLMLAVGMLSVVGIIYYSGNKQEGVI
jgi:hypothetical protein